MRYTDIQICFFVILSFITLYNYISIVMSLTPAISNMCCITNKFKAVPTVLEQVFEYLIIFFYPKY